MHKKIRIKWNAPFILAFVLLCLFTLVLNWITRGKSNELLFMVYHSSLLSPLTYLRFFTHILGHADFSHFFANTAYLLLIGPIAEKQYGEKKLLIVFLTTAFLSGLINFIVFPNTALLGASGVVFALIMLSSFTQFKKGEIPITVVLVAIVFLGQQIYEGIFVADSISQLTHIIGGIVGGIFGYYWNRE